MKILAKLLLSFITVAVLCAIVGIVGLSQLDNTKKSILLLSNDTIQKLDYVNTIDRSFRDLKIAVRSLSNPMGVDDTAFYQQQIDMITNARTQYSDARKKFEALAMSPEERRKYDTVLENLAKAVVYDNAVMATIEKARAASPQERVVIYNKMYQMVSGDERLALDNLLSSFQDLLMYDQQYYGVEMPKKTLEAAAIGRTIVLLITILAFIIALIFGTCQGIMISNRLKKTVKVLDKIAKGDLSEKLVHKTSDEFKQVARSVNGVEENVTTLVSDAVMLSEAAVAGVLQTRSDATRHQGDYKKIVDGFNTTLDLVITPINEMTNVLKRLAEGDLTQRMTGDYKGDFDVLKTALNTSLDSINDTLGQINTAVDQVAEGSVQVSQASQSLSQGATEQASSLEEITSSTTEISGQTRQNTENALKMNSLAKEAQENAEKGNNQMKDLVSAMSDINTSAEEIKKVVKAIDDISFQINLLALNANVEAARAGKYGKGFAVVAEEVRNLAVRSANSVKDTTRMVEEAISNIQRGNVLVEGTATQLDEIVGGSSQVSVLAEEVATAGREQTQGLDQISLGLNQIDQVTQSNTASAEESASASEELSSQAQQVKAMLSRFKLKVPEGKINNADVIAMLRAELANREKNQSSQAHDANPAVKKNPGLQTHMKMPGASPADIISLDDSNFGKF